MIPSINYKNLAIANTNLLPNKATVKAYIKNSADGCFTRINNALLNSKRVIKNLPKGTIGVVLGASLGLVVVKVMYSLVLTLASDKEKKQF